MALEGLASGVVVHSAGTPFALTVVTLTSAGSGNALERASESLRIWAISVARGRAAIISRILTISGSAIVMVLSVRRLGVSSGKLMGRAFRALLLPVEARLPRPRPLQVVTNVETQPPETLR